MSEAVLRSIVDAFGVALVALDHQYRVVYANDAFRAFVAPFDPVCGMACSELMDAFSRKFVDRRRLLRWVDRTRTDEGIAVERSLSLLDGRHVHVEHRPVPLEQGGGRMLVMRPANERTDVDVEAEKAKEVFTAMVSHELRTPVAGIVGMTELLLQGRLTPEDRDAVSVIARSANGLLELLNDLLDYAKIRAGKFEIRASKCRLDRELRDACSALDTIAVSRGLELVVHVDPMLGGDANADATRIRQVLTNLLGNALKFTPSGCVRVSAGVTHADRMRVEVEDTGTGVPPEAAERLFEAFFQGEQTAKRHFKGTGLGLAISREIVHALGGEIGYFANPIVGSTFWFEVPFERLGSSVSTPTPVPPQPVTSKAHMGTVLLAEDDPVNRRVLVAMLERLGYEVVVAEDGREAIAAAERQPFCAILMDCMMPGTDGFTATRTIRAGDGPNKKTAIVALTANAMRGDRERCLDAGMDDHVAKPVGFKQLEALLERWKRVPEPEPEGLDFLPADIRNELCAIYTRETQRRLALARDAMSGEDLRALAAVAHDVAGSSGALHASAVAECAHQLESGAREGAPVSRLEPILSELERRFSRWREALAA